MGAKGVHKGADRTRDARHKSLGLSRRTGACEADRMGQRRLSQAPFAWTRCPTLTPATPVSFHPAANATRASSARRVSARLAVIADPLVVRVHDLADAARASEALYISDRFPKAAKSSGIDALARLAAPRNTRAACRRFGPEPTSERAGRYSSGTCVG